MSVANPPTHFRDPQKNPISMVRGYPPGMGHYFTITAISYASPPLFDGGGCGWALSHVRFRTSHAPDVVHGVDKIKTH